MTPVRILYVMGCGRSGTTILSNTLGEIDGFMSAGELRYFWDRGFAQNRLCGCGDAFRECPIWSRVLADLEPVLDAAMVERMVRRIATPGTLPLIASHLRGLAGRRRNPFSGQSSYEAERAVLARLYGSIASTAKAEWIVDSSKLPSYGLLLDTIGGIDCRFLHVVRDPRGVAYSWARTRAVEDGYQAFFPRHNYVRSALEYQLRNALSASAGAAGADKYMRIGYEDFIGDPEASLRSVMRWLGTPEKSLPLTGDNRIQMSVQHTLAGNPIRFDTGSVALRPDTEWKQRMSRLAQRLVWLLGWPLSSRFGYRV